MCVLQNGNVKSEVSLNIFTHDVKTEGICAFIYTLKGMSQLFKTVLYLLLDSLCEAGQSLCPILSQFIKAVDFSSVISLHVSSHYCDVSAMI